MPARTTDAARHMAPAVPHAHRLSSRALRKSKKGDFMRVALRLSFGLSLFIGCTCGGPQTPDGGSPSLAFSDGPSFDFGSVDVGATAEHTFTLTNTGAAT